MLASDVIPLEPNTLLFARWDLGFADEAGLAREPQGSACCCFSSAEIANICCQAQFLPWVPGIRLLLSCLCSKCFTS